MTDSQGLNETTQHKALMKEAAKAIHDLRFIQANTITCLDLQGKAYLEAKSYMNKLAALQTKLEKEMLE